MLTLAFILLIAVVILGVIVQIRLTSIMRQYSQMPLMAGLTGAEIARRFLEAHGIYDVEIVEGRGWLTDHYNPITKRIVLSPAVYHGRSLMACAVAAHEAGHAVQHAVGYVPVHIRSALVPIVNFGSQLFFYLLIGGLIFFGLTEIFLWGAVFYYGALTAFALITLPVEIDASRRAYLWLQSSAYATSQELPHIARGLRWAAYTYVIQALSAIASLLYFLALLSQRD